MNGRRNPKKRLESRMRRKGKKVQPHYGSLPCRSCLYRVVRSGSWLKGCLCSPIHLNSLQHVQLRLGGGLHSELLRMYEPIKRCSRSQAFHYKCGPSTTGNLSALINHEHVSLQTLTPLTHFCLVTAYWLKFNFRFSHWLKMSTFIWHLPAVFLNYCVGTFELLHYSSSAATSSGVQIGPFCSTLNMEM